MQPCDGKLLVIENLHRVGGPIEPDEEAANHAAHWRPYDQRRLTAHSHVLFRDKERPGLAIYARYVCHEHERRPSDISNLESNFNNLQCYLVGDHQSWVRKVLQQAVIPQGDGEPWTHSRRDEALAFNGEHEASSTQAKWMTSARTRSSDCGLAESEIGK